MFIVNGEKLGSVYHGDDPRYTGQGAAEAEAPVEKAKLAPAKKVDPAPKAPAKES